MPKISMSTFIDYLITSGSPKQTVVAKAKATAGLYDPRTDFWKPLREGIKDMHEQGQGLAALTALQQGLTHAPKVSAYPVAIAGYKKWLGKKRPVWFKPPRRITSLGGLDIIVNPELGLEWSVRGAPTRHIIKTYFKAAKPAKKMIDAVLTLMQHAMPGVAAGAELAVLDVQRSRIWTSSSVRGNLMPLVQAEAAGFATLWSLLP